MFGAFCFVFKLKAPTGDKSDSFGGPLNSAGRGEHERQIEVHT